MIQKLQYSMYMYLKKFNILFVYTALNDPVKLDRIEYNNILSGGEISSPTENVRITGMYLEDTNRT